MRALWLIFCFILPILSFGQAKRAQNLIEKEKYEAAYDLLLKSTSKDSLASAEKFVLSQLFMTTNFAFYNIDSAYSYILASLVDFDNSDDKAVSRLEKDNFNSIALTQHKQFIEVTAFKTTKTINSENAYIIYLEDYPTAVQKDSAINFRNAEAFKTAARTDTYKSYMSFFEKYPMAQEVTDARTHYERLLFEHFTREGKLADYVNFLSDYPNTPYRSNCERQIFIISTGTNQVADFVSFIRKYPKSSYSKVSMDMLYHLSNYDSLVSIYPQLIITDSLIEAASLTHETMILVPNEDKYQFVNLSNRILLDDLSWVEGSLKCSPPKDVVLATHAGVTGLYGRNGELISKGEFDNSEELDHGYIIVSGFNQVMLTHKSGGLFGQTSHNKLLLTFPFLAYQDDDKWGMLSTTGLSILPEEYDSIFSFHNNILLQKDGKMGVFRNNSFYPALDGNGLNLALPFDNVEPVDENYLLIINGEQEGLMNGQLEFVVPMADQVIDVIDNGFFIEREDSIFNSTYSDKWFIEIQENEDWSIGRTKEQDLVKYKTATTFRFDDAELLGSYGLLAIKNDSTFLLSSDSRQLLIKSNQEIKALPMLSTSDQSGHYSLSTTNKKLPEILDRFGKKVNLPRYLKVFDLGEEYLLVRNRKNYTIFNNAGKPLLKNIDGASYLGNGLLSVFTDRNFGLLSERDTVNIPMIYNKHLQPISDTLFIAQLDDKTGIVNKNNETILPFQYSEIIPWNNSLVMVKIGYRQAIVNLQTRRTMVDQLSGWEPMFENEGEQFIKLVRNGQYGVFSNKNGLILDATFSELSNIGTNLAPVYKAEKYIDEADLYILLYYDQEATLFKKLVLSANQYQALSCNQGLLLSESP